MKMNLGWMRVVAKLVGEDKMIKKGGLLKKKKLVNWVSRSLSFQARKVASNSFLSGMQMA